MYQRKSWNSIRYLVPTIVIPEDQTQFGFYSMASIASKELAANNPGLHTSPYETNKGYLVLQTMFQIKDPKISLDFYSRILGMS
ncbi:hypothetical protein GOBAR_AA16298 [Gossypium barbadense]|uniref:Glyoxalase/fosfomycin resistance/dioxygenase domain-containing protein n=1 Tax=Gossypium barbadense TaxID=3634 RepID=A0A2P5XM15_GOSBA|nr:hypothetical protein GOBAR_AA16298 [Gossypium barbadense]